MSSSQNSKIGAAFFIGTKAYLSVHRIIFIITIRIAILTINFTITITIVSCVVILGFFSQQTES